MTDDTEGLRGCIRGKRADAIRRTVSLQQLRNPRVALQIPPHSHTPDPIPQSQPFVEPDNLPSTGPSNQTQIFPQEFQAVPQNSGNHAIPKALQFQEPNQVPMGPPPAPCSIPTHNNTQQQKPAVIVPPQPNPDVFQFGANQPSPPTLTSSSSWNQQTLHRSQSTFS
ncbi:hypothetical protein Pelo_9514 [Pelomyxa schiedti]|nr:hypothetical protein Pelo_9514 [Pelomyxa schiedti]